MSKWVILDREGVINDISEGLVNGLAAWRPYPGAIEAMAALSKAGFNVVIATNVSSIGKGIVDQSTTQHIHESLKQAVALYGGELKGVFYCPHTKEDDCGCRKPNTGLVDQIEAAFGKKVEGGYCLADSLKGLEFARAAKCTPVLVRSGKGTQTEVTILFYPKRAVNVEIYDDLVAFTEALTGQKVIHG